MAELTVPTSEAVYGFVVGRIIRQVSDTSLLAEDKPDIVAATGSVKFTPFETLGKSTDYSAFVLRETITAPIDESGHLVRHATAGVSPGLWLRVGSYKVTFDLNVGVIPSFTIDVTTAHTEIDPLDLVTAAP